MSKKLTPLRFEMASHSMWPVLRKGDFILVRPLVGKVPRVGSVVAFADNHRLVCHRLLREERIGEYTFYYTRGDCHFAMDSPKQLNDLWGEVIAVQGAPWRTQWLQRWGRAILLWLSFRDGMVRRLGGPPRRLRFSLFYMGLTPWLFFRPREKGRT